MSNKEGATSASASAAAANLIQSIYIYAESVRLILGWLAGLLKVNEVMSSYQMNAIKNESLYLFCRIVSLFIISQT